MKMIVAVALALVAVVVAVPVSPERDGAAAILRSENTQNEKGYGFSFETDNGINREENGELKSVLDEDKKPHDVVVVRGTYSYDRSDGTKEVIEYIADENGFQAFGPSIPVAPSARR